MAFLLASLDKTSSLAPNTNVSTDVITTEVFSNLTLTFYFSLLLLSVNDLKHLAIVGFILAIAYLILVLNIHGVSVVDHENLNDGLFKIDSQLHLNCSVYFSES
jgi:hypothetical protein